MTLCGPVAAAILTAMPASGLQADNLAMASLRARGEATQPLAPAAPRCTLLLAASAASAASMASSLTGHAHPGLDKHR
jgi:hypothetical protein